LILLEPRGGRPVLRTHLNLTVVGAITLARLESAVYSDGRIRRQRWA